MNKFIIVIGGVVSGLGKGITAASIGTLLKCLNLKINMQKADPYLNIDPGTISPFQHGEIFVTKDGAETDLDLGHYERFIDTSLTKESNITAGQIYKSLLEKERNGNYMGQTIQVIPHVINEIKTKIYQAAKKNNADVLIIEVGGTIGDIESLPFIEAMRQIRLEQGSSDVLFVFLGLLPYIKASHEYKTKPIQNSVKNLLSLGIQPDIIIARSEKPVSFEFKQKIALFCNISEKNVINAYNMDSIYKVPLLFYNQKLYEIIEKKLNFKKFNLDFSKWNKFCNKIDNAKQTIIIAIVGKYVKIMDAYLSIIESLNITGFEHNTKIKIRWVKSDNLNSLNVKANLKGVSGIIVPGGFGNRGIDGKILAVKYARENNIPFLGLCLGMQVACIEFARNVCNLEDCNSFEFAKNAKNLIFNLLKGKNSTKNLGGTLRLGEYKTTVLKGSLLFDLYKKREFFERHRHRYEFNNDYRAIFEKHGMVFSGIYQKENLIEVIELKKHRFFIATQFHPEFSTRPNKPNPLFNGFIDNILNYKSKNLE